MTNIVNNEVGDDGIPPPESNREGVEDIQVGVQGEVQAIHHSIWNQSYSVGIPQIDKQHQVMRRIIDELHNMNNDAIKIDVFLARLFNYTMIHLEQEELFLRRIGYPDIEAHLVGHRIFRIHFNRVDSTFTYNHQSFSKQALMDFLIKWWNNHILIADQQYAQYIREKCIDGQKLFELSQQI